MNASIYTLIALGAGMFAVIGGLSMVAHYYTLGGIKSKTVGDGQHGTARFATKKEIKETYHHIPFTPKDWRKGRNRPSVDRQGIILGSVGAKNQVTALVDTDDVHCLMIGASGVGKTAYFLYPNLEYACATGMSFLTTDTKGDLYIRKTQLSCSSDIETLLCQRYQYEVLDMVKSTNYSHYMYGNLTACLECFYKTAVPYSGYKVVDKIPQMSDRTLADDEIERINLGDTRHIALINLIYSGGSPTICKELARHDSVDISSHYYSNISTFVEAVAFESFGVADAIQPSELSIKPLKLANDNGYCGSQRTQNGDYTDCLSAMNPNGEFLDCGYCKYNTRSQKKIFHTNFSGMAVDDEKQLLNNSVSELIDAINLVRTGLGYESDIQSKILQLQAASNHYLERLKKGR